MAGQKLSVLTLNCLFRYSARDRLQAIGPLLEKTGIDLICLQEVVLRRNMYLLQGQLRSYRSAAFPHYGIGIKGGLVSFARQPFESTAYEVFRDRGKWGTLSGADRIIHKGFLSSWHSLPTLPLVLINTHLLANYDRDLSPGNRYSIQQRSELEQLAEAVDRLDRRALLVVAGDFNVPVTSPIFQDFLAHCELLSAFAAAPDEYGLIDHVLYRHPSRNELAVSANLMFEEPVLLADGRSVRASDRLGVAVELQIE